MSELINNREHSIRNQDERQQLLKEIIKELHAGKDVEEVKAKFQEAVGDVTVEEISLMEQSLMEEEGIPVEEVQRLCSVHAAVFEGSIEEIHRSDRPEDQPGHPIHTWKIENKEIDKLANFKMQLHLDRFNRDDNDENRFKLIEDFNLLWDVDKHYSRKENLLFPYLEKYGIYGPSKVMWGVDDAIRLDIKETKEKLENYDGNKEDGVAVDQAVIHEVTETIYTEAVILMPI